MPDPRTFAACRFPAALVGSVLCAAVLAGCSAGGPAPSRSPGDQPAPGASTAATGFILPTSCLSATDVSSLLGEPAYGPTVSADSSSLLCEYLTATQDGPIVDIEPAGSLTPATFAAHFESAPPDGATATPASGLGDKAAILTFSTGAHGVYVLVGNYTIDIASGSASVANEERLARKLLAG
ncbi:MAG: hypothetical protein ABJA94_03995 [Rhodoglobus sp.]